MKNATLLVIGTSALTGLLTCGPASADKFDTCEVSRGFHIQKDFGEDGPYIQFGTQSPNLFIVRTLPGITSNTFLSGNAGPGVNVTQSEFDWINHLADLHQGKYLTINWSVAAGKEFVWIQSTNTTPCP